LMGARGSRVTFTYSRNRDGAAELVAELEQQGIEASAWPLDIADDDQVGDVVADIAEQFGGIHTLVHAAGPHIPQLHLSKVAPAQFRANLEIEVMGFFNLAHQALPHLRAAQGSIVAVTTAATRRYPVRDGLSAGTKGSVEALVRALAVEEGRFGVRANCVGPGMLTDGMATRLMASGDLDETALAAAMKNIPLRRFGRALDIAEAVCFLASARANFISGQMLDVDGAYGA
jgi:3-oxoacyl-[acyl-carrier protein] reductase